MVTLATQDPVKEVKSRIEGRCARLRGADSATVAESCKSEIASPPPNRYALDAAVLSCKSVH